MRTIKVTIGMGTYCRTFQLFVEDDIKLKEEMVSYFSKSNIVFSASSIDEAVDILTHEDNLDAIVLNLV